MLQGLIGNPGEPGPPGPPGPSGLFVCVRSKTINLTFYNLCMDSCFISVLYFILFFFKNYVQGSPGLPGLPGEKVCQLIKFFFMSCDIMLSLFMMMFLFQGQEGPSPVIPGPRGQRVIYDKQH